MPGQVELRCTLGGKSSYILLTSYDTVETWDKSVRRVFTLPSSATLTYYNQRNIDIVESEEEGQQLVAPVISDVALVGSTLAYLKSDDASQLLLPLVDDPQRGQVVAVQVEADDDIQLQQQDSSTKSNISKDSNGKKSRELGKQRVQGWAAEVDKLIIHNAARDKNGLYLQLSEMNSAKVPSGQCNGLGSSTVLPWVPALTLFPGSMQLSRSSQTPRSPTS